MDRIVFSCLLICFTLILTERANAQLHIIAGYDLSYIENTGMNAIIHDFNNEHPDNSRQLKDVKFLNGFVAGGRYAAELGAFEMTYAKRFTRRIGDGYEIENRTTDLDLYYDIQTIGVTLEFGRVIKVGGRIDYNIYTNEVLYLENIELRDFKARSQTWGSKVFLGANLAAQSTVNFSVRLYYQWLWGYNDISEFETRFLGTDECVYCQEKPHSFGFTFIINNMLPW